MNGRTAPVNSGELLLPAFQVPYRIHYVMVCPESPLTEHVPECFQSPTLRRMSTLPKNVLQYLDPIGEYRSTLSYGRFSSYWLSIAYDHYFAENDMQRILESALVSVFFLNTTNEDCISVLRAFPYPKLVTSDDEGLLSRLRSDSDLSPITFKTEDEFCARIEAAILIACNMLTESGQNLIAEAIKQKLDQLPERKPPEDIRFTTFTPCRPNYMTLLQLLYPAHCDLVPSDTLEMSERVSHIVDSARQVADLVHKLNQFDQNGKSFKECRPPLVLVAPYHDPQRTNQDWKNRIKSAPADIRPIAESFIAAYLHEQDSNDYQYYMDDQDKAMAAPAGTRAALQVAAQRARYLDDVGFLHCSFQSSPYIRLPVKGRSLNTALSPFEPAEFQRRKDQHTIRRDIDSFGRKASSLFPPGVEEFIAEYAEQIVAFSDLPV